MAAAQSQVRRRHCGPKVKSGCQTCKIRHVKCDEARPSCQRCTNTGRKCDGYPQDLTVHSEDSPGQAMLQRISTQIPGNATERRGFNYFVLNTSAELSGYFDTSFWQRILLQASVAEPALRHAVISIGTLHESFANRELDYSSHSTERGFALNQYTKAIGHLRRSLATGNQAPLTALMSCVLFVCFDSIRGHFESAMVHLQSGLRILGDMKTRSAEESYITSSILAPVFMRLGIQAILYVDTRNPAERKSFAKELLKLNMRETNVPESFTTLDDARNFLCQASNGLFRMFYMSDAHLPACHQSEEALTLHEKYSMQLAQWNTAFEELMRVKSKKFTSKELRASALLKIQHTSKYLERSPSHSGPTSQLRRRIASVFPSTNNKPTADYFTTLAATIMANVAPPNLYDLRPTAEAVNSPESFKSHVGEFRIVVNLSKSLIAASEADLKSGRSPLTFSTDLGLVGPLYYCCVKCPDKLIRIEALEALSRYPRREGMWDSVAGIRMIREFWEIEERHQAFQKESEDENVLPIPLNEVVDLVLRDGMQWEWKWNPPVVRSTEVTPGICWTGQLKGQSLFGDRTAMSAMWAPLGSTWSDPVSDATSDSDGFEGLMELRQASSGLWES